MLKDTADKEKAREGRSLYVNLSTRKAQAQRRRPGAITQVQDDTGMATARDG